MHIIHLLYYINYYIYVYNFGDAGHLAFYRDLTPRKSENPERLIFLDIFLCSLSLSHTLSLLSICCSSFHLHFLSTSFSTVLSLTISYIRLSVLVVISNDNFFFLDRFNATILSTLFLFTISFVKFLLMTIN